MQAVREVINAFQSLSDLEQGQFLTWLANRGKPIVRGLFDAYAGLTLEERIEFLQLAFTGEGCMGIEVWCGTGVNLKAILKKPFTVSNGREPEEPAGDIAAAYISRVIKPEDFRQQ